jgi:hypothetical protein
MFRLKILVIKNTEAMVVQKAVRVFELSGTTSIPKTLCRTKSELVVSSEGVECRTITVVAGR